MRRTIFTFIMLCFVTLTLQAQDVWTAAGSSTIFGSHWNECGYGLQAPPAFMA